MSKHKKKPQQINLHWISDLLVEGGRFFIWVINDFALDCKIIFRRNIVKAGGYLLKIEYFFGAMY